MLVLIDADNVHPARVQALLDLLPAQAQVVASGHPDALAELVLPGGAIALPLVGWQRADIALVDAWEPSTEPLVIVSGDGDFALLAARHAGPVLVVSERASGRLRDAATVIDPTQMGTEPLRQWLAAAQPEI